MNYETASTWRERLTYLASAITVFICILKFTNLTAGIEFRVIVLSIYFCLIAAVIAMVESG